MQMMSILINLLNLNWLDKLHCQFDKWHCQLSSWSQLTHELIWIEFIASCVVRCAKAAMTTANLIWKSFLMLQWYDVPYTSGCCLPTCLLACLLACLLVLASGCQIFISFTCNLCLFKSMTHLLMVQSSAGPHCF